MSNNVVLEILEDNIFKYSFDKENSIIELIENSIDKDFISEWNEWKTSDGYLFGNQKQINSQNISHPENVNDEFAKELMLLNDYINVAAADYSMKKNINIGNLTPLTISKYHTGKTMGDHVDSYGDANPKPTISVVLYLNDNYEGGELYFSKFDLKIKPKPYTLVIFPSNEPYFHSSLPLISGTKYLMPAFFYKEKQ
jgi:hypothetical protein